MVTQNSFTEPTGLMFHHFHGHGHPEVQGSIGSEDFHNILQYVGIQNILPANDWLAKAGAQQLSSHHSCVTFDDALLCQYDVAKPVLDELNLTAFWFVYTSVFDGEQENLEVFRYFRCTSFNNIDEFYDLFFSIAREKVGDRYHHVESIFDPEEYLKNSPFYSLKDKWFRYLRDQELDKRTYVFIMENMMERCQFDKKEAASNLWLKKEQIQLLTADGHIIGLHSHTHPTTIAKSPISVQKLEYETNRKRIKELSGYFPTTVSHPCNSYNKHTIDLLGDMGVVMGFRADIKPMKNRGPLEYAREDHANLLAALSV
ncbi:Polysaccharide deacetylase [Pseudovibrio axinellae]|uniref:Chitooligosaccharide deacetylase n=1 Tax=Pseudovibrio axinellae TaxID=989403 RepID=A0A161X915_9HYPH|nr:polysaccharide deacetylase family protein [Pseudovibrio axinellae]KZL07213.1 Polysaccharide deacetylase [Pseudovibrio axinellae]SER83930.1 Polysaccharide deacetylase [Pseudovibrio axinellae]